MFCFQAHIDSDPANYTCGTFTVYCREMRDPLKCHITCFYQLAFNASEFEKKLRANNRFLVALQAALMEMPGGVSFAGTDGQIFKCAERAPTNSTHGDDSNSNKKSGSGVGGGTGGRGFGSNRGSPRVSEHIGEKPAGVINPEAPAGGSEATNRDGAYASGFAPTPMQTTRRFGSSVHRRHTSHRAPFRIPGRLRHYTGMLGDMSEVVTFDAYDGQLADSDDD